MWRRLHHSSIVHTHETSRTFDTVFALRCCCRRPYQSSTHKTHSHYHILRAKLWRRFACGSFSLQVIIFLSQLFQQKFKTFFKVFVEFLLHLILLVQLKWAVIVWATYFSWFFFGFYRRLYHSSESRAKITEISIAVNRWRRLHHSGKNYPVKITAFYTIFRCFVARRLHHSSESENHTRVIL